MSMHLKLKFPDKQTETYHLVVTIMMPDGSRNIACDDVLFDKDNNVYNALVYTPVLTGKGLDSEDAIDVESSIVAIWPAEAPFIAVAQEAFERKSDQEIFEERLEEEQAKHMMQSRAEQVIGNARKKRQQTDEDGPGYL